MSLNSRQPVYYTLLANFFFQYSVEYTTTQLRSVRNKCVNFLCFYIVGAYRSKDCVKGIVRKAGNNPAGATLKCLQIPYLSHL